jgi:feruloyl esterase
MEVWMPAQGWNNYFKAQGTGGMGGSIPLPAMAATLKAGFATAGTDGGHTGSSSSYALDHPEKVIDFAHRAAHEMNLKAKAIIAAYYEQGPKLSLIDGCGTGAQTAQNAIQRYPSDYDAVAITGQSHMSRHRVWQLWAWHAVHKEEASFIPAEKFEMVHNAVMNACDGLDRVRNREIEDPRQCKFDPAVLQCKAGDGPSCLTRPQVEALRKIYAGPSNPRTEEQLYFPPTPGSELTFAATAAEEPFNFALEWGKYFVFDDPNWHPRTRPFNFDSDMALAETPENLLLNANNPDIREFVNRGGKVLLYEGWSDGTTIPGISIDYYNRVLQTIGAERARDSVRLFMIPGMTHCEDRGEFNMVSELERWIHTQKAPDKIIGTRVRDGKAVGTRLLCPYPQVATYSGTGNTDDAANYTCRTP